MRICHLVTSLHYGGVERRMQVIAEAAHDRRGSLHFIAIGGGGFTAGHIASLGHDVTCLQASPSVYAPATFVSVLRAIRRLRPDVVHTHGAEANFHGLPAAWLAGTRVRIGEEIGLADHSLKARLAFRLMYRLAHSVVVVSPVVAEHLARAGEAPVGRIHVVEPPVRRLEAASGAAGRSRPRCIFVGRLVRSKNLRAVLRALHDLAGRGRPFEFWIVGEGPERPVLQAMAHDLGLGEFVKLLGYQDRPEEFARDCDLFVLPSESEGFSNALVEAMAVGVPVLSTDTGGARDLIRDGETGWLLPTADTPVLAARLDELLSMPAGTRSAIGAAGRRRVLERSSPEAYVRRLEELYEAEWRRQGAGISR